MDFATDENSEMPNDSLLVQYTKQVLKRTELLKQYVNLSPFVQSKIRALRKLQLQTTEFDVEFHQRVCELEREYEEKHRDIFMKRNAIVNGIYEPTPTECDYTDPVLTTDYTNIMENLNLNVPENQRTNENQKGIPDFWLTIFKYFPLLEPFVREHDEPVLKYLTDVRSFSKTEPELSFILEFHFAPNDFFSNTVLTKEYFLKCSPDPEDPLSFDGPEIYKCIGCKINWFDGKDFTIRTIKKKCSGNVEKNAGTRLVNVKSFFNFFEPPEIPLDENDENFDVVNNYLEKDFEVGHYLKERIIPRAILYFTGESEEFSPDETSSENSDSEECPVSENDISCDGDNDLN